MHASPATTSNRLTADTAVVTGSGRLMGVLLEGNATNAASVIVYDNTAASGTILCKLLLPGNAAGEGVQIAQAEAPKDGIVFNNGVYADISGTGAAMILYFVKD